MSTTERDAQREELRARIVEAARDIVSEKGFDALSMRALAERIDHSPGVIYHHFRDKEELVRTVMAEGAKRLGRSMEREIGQVGPEAGPLERYAATGRAYARFALENTAYFRAMFELPDVGQLENCPEGPDAEAPLPEASSWRNAVALVREASERGEVALENGPEHAAVVGWGTIHGLTSLYVGGHLRDEVGSHEEFMALIEGAIRTLGKGWRPR